MLVKKTVQDTWRDGTEEGLTLFFPHSYRLQRITPLRIAYCPDDVLEVDTEDTNQVHHGGETSTSTHIEIPVDGESNESCHWSFLLVACQYLVSSH